MKKIYVVRHCKAIGQAHDAPLTDKGFEQAGDLSNYFSSIKIDRIISSPYIRAVESIKPYADKAGLSIERDKRLTERILSSQDLSNWSEKLKSTFEDPKLKFEGGESNKEAMQRIVEVVEEIFEGNDKNIIIVTHGNLMSLLFNYYDKNFGFEHWNNLSNPDVFLLTSEENRILFKRVWKPT